MARFPGADLRGQTGREVDDAHGALGLVDVLTARTRGAVDIHAEIAWRQRSSDGSRVSVVV